MRRHPGNWAPIRCPRYYSETFFYYSTNGGPSLISVKFKLNGFVLNKWGALDAQVFCHVSIGTRETWIEGNWDIIYKLLIEIIVKACILSSESAGQISVRFPVFQIELAKWMIKRNIPCISMSQSSCKKFVDQSKDTNSNTLNSLLLSFQTKGPWILS